MNIGSHQVPDRRIDETVAGEGRHIPERLGNDSHPEMAQAAGRSGMPRMMVTIILDDQFARRKARGQYFPQPQGPGRAVQGSTCRKGSTSTRSNTPALT
jgi:hypothetical protein